MLVLYLIPIPKSFEFYWLTTRYNNQIMDGNTTIARLKGHVIARFNLAEAVKPYCVLIKKICSGDYLLFKKTTYLCS